MPVDRIKRINELIRRDIASSLLHIGQSEGVDTTAIMIVDVSTSRDLRNATIYVSLKGTAEERDWLIKWLRRRRIDFQSSIAQSLSLKYTPKLMFRPTTAIEKGDRVLDILAKLDQDAGQDQNGPCLPTED